jgi:trk system potassium uptake protein
MRFVVVGLGTFGTRTALSLAAQGHEVVVVDDDRRRVDAIRDIVSHAVVADTSSFEGLESIGFRDCGAAIVCLGPELGASILVVHYLKELGARTIVAKALSEDHLRLLELVGADRVICPDKDEAVRLAHVLGGQDALDGVPATP